MLIDLLQSILMGLVSGFSEFLPVSGTQAVLQRIMGWEGENPLFRLLVDAACLAALLAHCGKRLMYLNRQLRMASKRRRLRQPDVTALRDTKVLLRGILPMAIVTLLAWFYGSHMQGLVLLSVFLGITGFMAYLPAYVPAGDRISRDLDLMDSILLGSAGGLALIPGLSGMAAMTCLGAARGMDRKYTLEMSLLLSVPVLLLVVGLDAVALVITGMGGLTLATALAAVLASGAAFGSAYGGISLMKYLAVNLGYGGFAYYSWGLAMLTFILYLIT